MSTVNRPSPLRPQGAERAGRGGDFSSGYRMAAAHLILNPSPPPRAEKDLVR